MTANARKNLQQELHLLGDVTQRLRELDHRLVALCGTEQAAFRLCVQQSNVYYPQAALAEHMGMNVADLNCCLNADQNDRPKYLSRTRQINLRRICGNRAVDQWADLYERGMLACQTSREAKIAELRAQLRELEQ